jgi:hypothetical protein
MQVDRKLGTYYAKGRSKLVQKLEKHVICSLILFKRQLTATNKSTREEAKGLTMSFFPFFFNHPLHMTVRSSTE